METLLTLNNARVVRELLIFLFSRSKSTLGCYIVKTTANVARRMLHHTKGKR